MKKNLKEGGTDGVPPPLKGLKAVSSLGPCNRRTSVALESMKELPLDASNVVQDSEKEAYDLEIHNFQNDHFSDIVEESVDLWWRIPQNVLYFQGWHLLC
ncbi:hypothetical protein AVEN_218446-1 [Araneus ventricosus]|uniref:Uncharacterized protein n=1 Tax=Araneus ventricosus TaxID=182803 RepID=A0A4Y2KUV4_ARAVE|nr:hypothetical protein AVEN_218446-1 [Araneus ventricosus]